MMDGVKSNDIKAVEELQEKFPQIFQQSLVQAVMVGYGSADKTYMEY